MVISKNGGKRKKKEASAIVEQTTELPKRTKVHAQRKFAQGQGQSSSSSLSLIPQSQSQQSTPDKQTQPTELLPNLRPNTEDFLTFLCFRGTSVLPSHLDYLNTNKRSATTSTPDQTDSSFTTAHPKEINEIKSEESPVGSSRERQTRSSTLLCKNEQHIDVKKVDGKLEPEPEKPAFIPFAVRKNAESVIEGKRRQAVQALKKKYQEQRMAKTKLKNIQAAKPATGRQTRSTKKEEEEDEEPKTTEITKETKIELTTIVPDKKEESAFEKKTIENDTKEKKLLPVDVSVPAAPAPTVATRKISLRNSNVTVVEEEAPKIPKPTKATTRSAGRQQISIETNEPKIEDKLKELPSPKTRKGKDKREPEPVSAKKARETPSTKEIVPKDQPISRVTRQKPAPAAAAVAVVEKIPDPPAIVENQKDQIDENQSSTSQIKRTRKEEDFSSDDDEPLVKTIKKPESEASAKGVTVKNVKNKKGVNKGKKGSKAGKTEDAGSIKSDDKPLSKRKLNEKVKPNKKQAKCNDTPSKSLKSDTIVEDEIVLSTPEPRPEPELSKVDPISPKRKGGKKAAADRQIRKTELTDVSHTDQSETEVRTARPMRKTKTAAAIYMELIGQKLNLGDFDDDNLSMDSFPELPNVRKTEQMENDMKANLGKEKIQPKKPEKKAPAKKAKPVQNTDELDAVKTEPLVEPPPKPKEPVKKKRVNKKQPEDKIAEAKEVVKTETMPEKPKEDEKFQIPQKKKRYSKKAEVDTAESLVLLAQGATPPKKLEKSFSDSDDEPLAVKVTKRTPKPRMPKKQKDEPAETIKSPIDLTPPKTSQPKEEKSKPMPEVKQFHEMAKPKFELSIPELKFSSAQFSKPIEKPDLMASTSAKNTQDILPINLSPAKAKDEIKTATTPFKSVAENNSPTAKSTTSQAISSILANLMPSKEESGKIFGIASVTLAQSSGPNDTKCTLGKCGSVHKPPLGPVVPTESLLLNDQMSSKERRKAKVNMTHEQIQKWLTECSANADYPEEDLLDEEIDLTTPPKPINYMVTPSPFRELVDKDAASTSSRTSKQKLTAQTTATGREKLSSIPKGPSLKAKPIAVKDDRRNDDFDAFLDDDKNKTTVPSVSALATASAAGPSKESFPSKVPEKPPIYRSDPPPLSLIKETKTNVSTEKISKEESISSTSAAQSSKPQNQTKSTAAAAAATPTPKSIPSSAAIDKKPIYNQRRTPVYNTKITETTAKSKPIVNTFGAFSPENEASVYSFDKEENTLPTSTPFRRHSSRRESTSTSRIDESERVSKKADSKLDKSTESTPKKSVTQQAQSSASQQQQQQVSLTLSPEDNSKSIAVQVSMDPASIPKPKSSADGGNDSDSEGHTFYIPLQGTNVTGSKSDQLIQGVAVKLGTEGPEGPNQRVIMHAKLVTKAQMGSNTTPIPEGMANVHEIVKSLIASKESGSKSVPVGTVQPRFKSSGAVATTSISAAAALASLAQQQPSASRQTTGGGTKQRYKYECTIKPSNNTVFPRHDDPAQMVEALTFRPTEKEFQDPMEFIERITPVAARFGLCRIIPPANFKPECNISDDMRFRAYNLYVHKMLHRWGPSAKEFSAIKKYLATQRITLTHPPWIGGMEVDLPRLYHTVQELGGLKEVIEKKKWPRVAEEMCIPKSAQDRVTKLDDIYCKYLLPYDTLSPIERQKLFDEVEADWAKTEAKARRNADRSVSNDEDDEESEDDDDDDVDNSSLECIVKGRNMPLNAFFRIARNTMALWFKNTEPTSAEVEAEFWRHVAVRDSHVCVHSGSIDSSGRGYGFPAPGSKAKAGAKHPWNLKVLTNNQGSILRSIGPVTGVTVPTLHVGMLFSACCWYRDPHGLPWIEYLHTGGSKIWYGVPDEQSANFRAAFTSLVPTHCQNKTVWLPCDTAMVPPHMLTERGVSLCRTEQEPGQFVVVFPRAYTSSLCTGYSISESVYFATNSWLDTAEEDFKDIHDSCEPAMFSLEQLLFSVAADVRTNTETLAIVLPMITEVYEREIAERDRIKAADITRIEKVPVKNSKDATSEDYECDTCRANLYISWIKTDEDNIYCLQHGLKHLTNNQIQAKDCKLIQTYTIDDIAFLINKIKEKSDQQMLQQQQQQQQPPPAVTTKKTTGRKQNKV